MHGIGNNFVLIHPEEVPQEPDLSALAIQLCAPRSVGSDGLLVVTSHPVADAEIIMLNPDGGRAELCGNGLRCSAAWCQRHLNSPNPISLVMAGRTYTATRTGDGRFAVAMGTPTVGEPLELELPGAGNLPGIPVEIGNPHLVVIVPEGAQEMAIEFGPALEHHPAFPSRTNVHFVEIDSPSRIIQHTWERGAGITWACGSGACACTAAVIEYYEGAPQMDVLLPGGRLTIEQAPDQSLTMVGPATFICEGELT